jgi:cytosine/adenosine deaminase-related metal-dependent hydrolase
MPLIPEAGFQIADAFTPPPMTSVTVRQALDAWGEKTMVFGGIPSVMLSPAVSDRDFESHLVRLLRSIRREDRFALGIGDTTPMEASFERIRLLSRLYDEYGVHAQ